jgi:excinuclease ABC subunit C
MEIKEQIQNLPDGPGVYFFRRDRQILYIGKATSLRSRVRSYFPSTALGASRLLESRGGWIQKMTGLANQVDFLPTDSVLEALILESREIKRHQPPYNIREKDDKSFLYVGLTAEDFPRVLTFRGNELRQANADKNFLLDSVFGPFPHGSELREALKIIRKIFPYRTKCLPGSGRPCFDAQLGLCPGVCSGAITKTEYRKIIRQLKLFFEGKKERLMKTLEREMRAAAKRQEFEKADQLKRRLFALKHIQDVALIKKQPPRGDSEPSFRIEAYDIAHLSGTNSVGVMTVAEQGEINRAAFRRFRLRGRSAAKSDDTGNLLEVLVRRLGHPEWPLPNLIVVDGGQAQINLARHVLETRGLVIPVASVVKDERHRAREILGAREIAAPYRDLIIALNQESHRYALAYHRKLRGRVV